MSIGETPAEFDQALGQAFDVDHDTCDIVVDCPGELELGGGRIDEWPETHTLHDSGDVEPTAGTSPVVADHRDFFFSTLKTQPG